MINSNERLPCHRDLSDNFLTGSLPASLGKLGDYLEHVDLSSNELKGSLPSSWSGMAALQNMSLANNSLEGPLPPSWSALNVLEVRPLRAWPASLTKKAGNASLRRYPMLQALDLSYNRLTGSLPSSWGRLGFLAHLNLRSNRLIGSLPSGWSKQTALLQL